MTPLEVFDDVSHETNAVELYIVVDVETTGLNPAQDRVLTLGAVAVTYDHKIVRIDDQFFYQRIDQSSWIEETNWYATILDCVSTLSWWVQQPFEVQQEAWRDENDAETQSSVVTQFANWIATKRRESGAKPVFVANPVSFDKPFVDQLFWSHERRNPFDYRSLCLRSMRFGGMQHEKWGTQVRTNKSLVPHHAFFDAYAAAQDLVDILNDRDETGFDDGLYWLNNPAYSTVSERCFQIEGKGWHGRD